MNVYVIFLFFRRGESDPDPGQPDRPAIGGGGAADQPPQQGGAEGRVADPDWIGSVDPDPDPGGQKWRTKVENVLKTSCFEVLDGLFLI